MAKELKLSEAKVGGTYEIVKINGLGAVKRRIMDMGLIPRARVKVARVAPLGDPIDLVVKGYDLTIRKSEASFIIVKVVGE